MKILTYKLVLFYETKHTLTAGLSKFVFDVRFLVWVTFLANVPLTNGWTNLGAKRFILKKKCPLFVWTSEDGEIVDDLWTATPLSLFKSYYFGNYFLFTASKLLIW